METTQYDRKEELLIDIYNLEQEIDETKGEIEYLEDKLDGLKIKRDFLREELLEL